MVSETLAAELDLTVGELDTALRAGAIVVRYPSVVSIVIATLEFRSKPYLLANPDHRFLWCLPYLLLTLFTGWWGLPWGPWRSIQAIWTCLQGGADGLAEDRIRSRTPSGTLHEPELLAANR